MAGKSKIALLVIGVTLLCGFQIGLFDRQLCREVSQSDHKCNISVRNETLQSSSHTESVKSKVIREERTPTPKPTSRPQPKAPPKDRAFQCLSPSKRLPSGVCRDIDNQFTLPGEWKEAPSLAAAHFNDNNACAAQKARVYPFDANNHGCCMDKIKNGPSPSTVFWPDSYNASAISKQSSSILSFLEAVRGRNVLFVGDSLTLIVFEGVIMEMNARSITYQQTLIVGGSTRHDVFVPSHNATLRLLYHYNVEDPKETEIEPNNGPFFLRQALLSQYMQTADIVMANVGLHMWPLPSLQGRQMKHIYDLYEQAQKSRGPDNQICFLWRKTLPQHFPTERETGEYGHRWKNWSQVSSDVGCAPIRNTWVHPSDKAMEAVRFLSIKKQKKTPVLDYTSIFQDASAYHSAVMGDCSHYCFTTRLWSPLLLVTAEAIRHACER